MKVKVLRRKIKNAYIYILDENQVEVRVPEEYTDQMINSLIQDRKAWIQKKQSIINSEKKSHHDFFEKKTMYYLGKSYSIESLNHSTLNFYSNDWCEWFNFLIYDQASSVFYEHLNNLCQKMSVKPPELKLRKMRKRWGTCYPYRNQIVLNRKMIFLPLAALELVIVHELVHFEFPHHQKEFYLRLSEYLPDYQKREKILSKYRYLLETEICN